MNTSRSIARLMGPILLVIGIGMAFGLMMEGADYSNLIREFIANRALIFLTGILALVAGVAIVNAHNVWVQDWRVIITILGWLLVLRGVMLLVFPLTVQVFGDPVAASLDGAKMERIVDNLVMNAAKHTPPEGPIEIRLDARGRDLLLVVEDEGPGIADEYKQEVFETFNRGPKMSSMTPGAGIGLALVSRFAAIQGGRTWVEDAPGGGASFHVLIPDCVLDVAATVD